MNNSLFFAVIALLFSFVPRSHAQTNAIEIDSKSAAFTIVDLQNFDMNGGSVLKYEIDLDKNTIPDLTFQSQVSWGSGTTIMATSVTAGDSCTFAVNTKGRSHFISKTLDTVYYSSRIVNIFNPGDTLYSDSCVASQATTFASSYSHSGMQVNIYINEWLSGTHYMGIKKTIGQKEYLGWIKLHVNGYYAIKFSEYAIQTLPIGINEADAPQPVIYPNPINTNLTIENMNCKKIELYDAFGRLVLNKELGSSALSTICMDTGNISKGMYFLKLYEANTVNTVIRKIIKE